MLRQLFVFVFALGALNATADTTPEIDPLADYISLEIEKMELEQELFGVPTNGEEIISIASIDLYEIEEELDLGFDTADHVPNDFNAKEGMNDIDWSTIELYEVEEEIELGFNTKDYLPKGFNPYQGMIKSDSDVVCVN